NVNGCKGKAAEVEFVADLQGGEKILLLARGVGIVLNLLDLVPHRLQSTGHHGGVKAILLAAAVEVGRVKRQGMVHLEPGNSEGHHHIGHGVGLGEEILNFLARFYVPRRNARLDHFVLGALGKSPSLSHRLHDLEGALLGHAAGDEIEHNIVAAADGLGDRGRTGGDEILGVAQPHVGAVGEAGKTHQDVKLIRLGVQEHAPDEAGAKFGNGAGTGGAEDGVILKAQDLAGAEDGHGVLVVQGNLLGVDASQVLHHADHGGV